MVLSTDRILTTHVGALPRPRELVDLLLAQDCGGVDPAVLEETIRTTVVGVLEQQASAGLDIVNDGAVSKISFGSYLYRRLNGLAAGDPRPMIPADLDDFPEYRAVGAVRDPPKYVRPVCSGPISSKSLDPLRQDLDRLSTALRGRSAHAVFFAASSPGAIAMFMPNEHYRSPRAYLEALAEAMREEYETIANTGMLLQVDCPDLGLDRHVQFRDLSDDEFVRTMEVNIEMLNAALVNVPAERMRLHVCWGNYHGPHTRDIPVQKLLRLLFKAKPTALLFEAANPRHEWEWEIWQAAKIPEQTVLVPGVIDTNTNFVEPPELVAQRLERYAKIVGRERVIAGTDCGYHGFGLLHQSVAWRKLRSLCEGAALASRRLWTSSHLAAVRGDRSHV